MQERSLRERLSLDTAWQFYRGDIDAPLENKHLAAYMNNKAGYARGAAKASYDDSEWRSVDLPHDWSVEGPFDPSNHVNNGYLPRGVGWYRRYFRLDEVDRGRRISITFDGVATHCTVWVNGHLVHRNWCGYTAFTIDITEITTFGEELNTIAVRVDASYMEGWWYEGAGIYRHVWLTKTSPVHIKDYGVFVRPERVSETMWKTHVETTIQNDSDTTATITVLSVGDAFFNGRGDPTDAIIEPHQTITLSQSIETDSPMLWSVDAPNLYHLAISVSIDGHLVDGVLTRYAYRTTRFDPDRGFFLNDEPLKLLGTCNHQDHAGVGVAVPDSIHEFRIRRLKAMGCNAYRCAHNPPAPEILDACDRLGMLVIDENRNFGTSPEHLNQLREMVLRDRNHPSIVLWSICNEEAIQGTPTSARIAAVMQREVRKLDPSRPVTAAVSGGILNDDAIANVVEIMGINYQPKLYDPWHAKHPNVPLLASETHCALTTRGEYETDPKRQVFDSYDTQAAFWGQTARVTWREVSSRPFVAGLFVWTGFDYRGEPAPHEWPSINSHWGIMDTCGFPKDSFYLHKSWFTREPVLHILPHWNWPGREGQPIRVMAFTNCDEVQLFLNGRLLERRQVDPIEMVSWEVPYEPGELRAVGYRDGKQACDTKVVTTGPATALSLRVHEDFVGEPHADGHFAIPITVSALDSHGRVVPTASNFVQFEISGPGIILGVGNGNPNCLEADKASARSLFNGLAQVIVQTTTTPGRVVLRATSEGLREAVYHVDTVVRERRAVPPAQFRHFINDWRMSPVTATSPDPNQVLNEGDVNSWDRIQPTTGPQSNFPPAGGFTLYRATFTPRRNVQSAGGRIVFRRIVGRAEVYLAGQCVASKPHDAADPVEVALPPGSGTLAVTVLLETRTAPAGLAGAVEILVQDAG